ncbi:MAG: hypothetical protein K2P79_00805 [Sphingomonas sp.]|nr:hypothetical protein [Sphingomonas sp.]
MRTKLVIAALAGASLATTPVFARSANAPVAAANPAASLSLADVGKVRTAAPRGKARKISGAALPIALIAAAAIGVGIYLGVDGANNDPVSR